MGPGEIEAILASRREMADALESMRALSIAAIQGWCVGGGVVLAAACDLRLAVPAAKFFYPVMKLGFLPQPSDPGRLAALIGPARAKLVLVAGRKLTADQALAFGLVEAVVDRGALDAHVSELCADVLGATSEHADAIKRLVGPA